MASAESLLSLPLGNASAALWDPLLVFGLRYRHNPTIKTLPWIATRFPEPYTHAEAAQIVRLKSQGACDASWLSAWERVVPVWRHPSRPVAFAYIRVSDRRKAASGLSCEVQIEACLSLYRQLWPGGEVELGPAFSDPMTSGWKTRFLARLGGAALHEALQPGDHILFYQLDRSARLAADSAHMLTDVWIPGGITPHFHSFPNLPIKEASGGLVYNIMSGVAEWYSKALSERMRDMAQGARRQGRPTNGNAPRGWMIQRGNNGWKKLAPDAERRRQMAYIERLRDVERMTWRGIGRLIGKHPWVVIQDYRAWKEILASGVQPRPPKYQQERERLGMDEQGGQGALENNSCAQPPATAEMSARTPVSIA